MTQTSETTLAALAELAKKATPGPWVATEQDHGEWEIDQVGDFEWGIATIAAGAGLEDPNGRSNENATYIAACSPSVIIAAAEREGQLAAERTEALRVASSLTKTLTRLTVNGSEFFVRNRILDDYFADEKACEDYVRGRYEEAHQLRLKLKSAAEREAMLVEALREIDALDKTKLYALYDRAKKIARTALATLETK